MKPVLHIRICNALRSAFSALCIGIPIALHCMSSASAAEPKAVADGDALPPVLAFALQPWTGKFDGMVERSMIRVAIPVSLTTYFVDGATQKGATYEVVQAFERHVKKSLGKRGRKLHVVVVPARRDRILEMVIEGRADIAAGNITVTDERAQKVAFSPPFLTDVDEVVVTGHGIKAVKSLDDLVGIDLHVRKSTSLWGSLERVNAERTARGEKPLTVVAADELLRSEDLLEMVGAGVIPATATDSPLARPFARHFKGLTVHYDVPLAKDRSYAWAYRKDDAKTGDTLARFVKTARKGTKLGNIILNRYTKKTDWIKNVRDGKEQQKLARLVDFFRAYADRYDFDWLMIAAQGYQESKLDQKKRSHVGAIGVMQVMPATAKDASVGIPDIHVVEHNIHAGVKYLAFLRTRYLSDPKIDTLNRTLLSFAAYNAGPGNLRKAQKRAEKLGLDPTIWFDNVEIAMGQTVSHEPVVYVRNIFKYYTAFKLVSKEREARKENEKRIAPK